jgi:hypothetical protein
MNKTGYGLAQHCITDLLRISEIVASSEYLVVREKLRMTSDELRVIN